MTEINYVIKAGDPIPADVLMVKDVEGDEWAGDGVRWSCTTTAATERYSGWSAVRLSAKLAPLTVTAVREPEPERKLIGPPHAHLDAPCTDECYEPAQADVSVLLDLVRQYGDQIGAAAAASECEGPDEVAQHERQAEAILARIAALVQNEERAGMQVLTERDENAEWADRLAAAIAEHLGVDIGEHSNANLPWQAALIALEFTASTRPDPSVLSLPQVPDGAAALIGTDEDETRYERSDSGRTAAACWRHPFGAVITFAEVLDNEGSVTVVMREPRTWPKLDASPAFKDDAPSLLEVNGWRWHLVEQSGGRYFQPGTLGERTIQQLREMGDVTEVFEDEPGGAA